MSHMKAKFETSASSHGRKRVGVPKPKMPSALAKLPHITKLMALAIRLEHLLATGQVKDQAEIARVAGTPSSASANAKFVQLRSCRVGRRNDKRGSDSLKDLRLTKPSNKRASNAFENLKLYQYDMPICSQRISATFPSGQSIRMSQVV
jgi:hypothetical protein